MSYGIGTELHWLLAADDFDGQVNALRGAKMCDTQSSKAAWQSLQALANRRLDFMQTRKLDRLVREKAERASPPFPRLKLALIGSSTLDHLAPRSALTWPSKSSAASNQ